jgi:hypothetical protein
MDQLITNMIDATRVYLKSNPRIGAIKIITTWPDGHNRTEHHITRGNMDYDRSSLDAEMYADSE